MRQTLGRFKTQYSWPAFLNLGSDDPRWLMLLNEALERLLNMGLWVGTVQRYQVCTNNACLTWPREFETIEVVDVCGQPVTIRNQWFEFLDQGPGLWRGGCGVSFGCGGGLNYLDRGRGFVTFDDPRVACYLRLFTQFAADAGKTVNVRGWDSIQQWVLTDGGSTVGETVTLTDNYVDTATQWMPQVFREVIKEQTLGAVRAYYYAADDPYLTGLNPDGSSHVVDLAQVALTPIAIWEPDELVPNYRRCVVPALERRAGCCGGGVVASVQKTVVTVMAKLAFVPLANDSDLLPLTNGPAVKMAMLSVLKQERGDAEGARAAMYGWLNPVSRCYEDGAVPLLEAELATFQGAGSVAPLRIESGVDNAGVLNLI